MSRSAQQRSPLEQFLLYLEYERGLAANTVFSYRQELEKFFVFLEKKKLHYLRLGENDILDFVKQEGRRGGAVSSQALFHGVRCSHDGHTRGARTSDLPPVSSLCTWTLP